jgi:phage baseplate assembly protein W
MSFDFRLEAVCPHQVVLEEQVVSDYLVIRPTSALASSNAVVYVNGAVVPPAGLGSSAFTNFAATGPFLIYRDVNDFVEVSIDNAPFQLIRLNSGTVTASQVAKDLDGATLKAQVVNGHIQVASRLTGPTSSLFFGSGTAHTLLGIASERVYVGKTLYPGWGVVVDPASATRERMIQFNSPLMCGDDIVEVSYFTNAAVCRRCLGLKIENDFRYDTMGNKQEVSEEDLMSQEIWKMILTLKGSNVFHNWYGTLVGKKPGGKFIDLFKSQIVAEVSGALRKWKDIKLQQASIQEVTPGEFPHLISQN